ncbi:hypothetical protein ACFRMQ_31005 [Kitasatospora sp. NPDC056783]|uniref:hypothetical protein n=1 Tax=Kitasatospora sp. NPDC056783 TaxID=3345943 RepID=UPI0036AB679F
MSGYGGRRALSAAVAVAVVAAGAVGYLDWRGHRPIGSAGREPYLCTLPTGGDTPLGRLLPPGGQDVEERSRSRPSDPVSCAVRVDGRTAITVSATFHDGGPALSPEAAKHPDARSFSAGKVAASWPGGATVSDYCYGGPAGHVQLVVAAGEAARGGPADRQQTDLEKIAQDRLQKSMKDVCQ